MNTTSPYAVQLTSRTVIERKLLTALAEGDQVAILATRRDLEDMIFALESYDWNAERTMRCRELAKGMKQLLKEVFGPNLISATVRSQLLDTDL